MAEAVEACVRRWLNEGVANVEEIVVIGRENDRTRHGLGPTLAGHPLVEFAERGTGQLAYLSSWRCKGIEALAVIVVGFGEPQFLAPDYQHAFFLSASRARQLLAVFFG